MQGRRAPALGTEALVKAKATRKEKVKDDRGTSDSKKEAGTTKEVEDGRPRPSKGGKISVDNGRTAMAEPQVTGAPNAVDYPPLRMNMKGRCQGASILCQTSGRLGGRWMWPGKCQWNSAVDTPASQPPSCGARCHVSSLGTPSMDNSMTLLPRGKFCSRL